MDLLLFFAKRFVAGKTAEEGMKAVKILNSKNIMATLDILGENVTDKKMAEKATMEYISLLEKIHEEKINSSISLKLTQLGIDIDYDFCKENLEKIVKKAIIYGNFVRIDMEGSKYTERTISMFKELVKKYGNSVGAVIQAYLFRSEKDVNELIKLNARVRLCKGAYKEPPTIAYKKKSDVDKNYIKLMEKLLLHGNYPAIATHDEKIINHAKEFARNNKIGKEKFEFQMLYGIRPKLQEKLANEYNVRVYVPFGKNWFPYYMRRLRERKENVFFLLKNLFRR